MEKNKAKSEPNNNKTQLFFIADIPVKPIFIRFKSSVLGTFPRWRP